MSQNPKSASPVSFVEAARAVLADAGTPLHYREITKRGLAAGWIATAGATPWESLNARVSVHIQRYGTKN